MAFGFRGDRNWLRVHPTLGSGDGLTCGFAVIDAPTHAQLRVIFSSGEGWEHVSVSLPNRCPHWGEMQFVKEQFWGDEDVVVQFHPRRSEYVNRHPYCLHLWRQISQDPPTPPRDLVG